MLRAIRARIYLSARLTALSMSASNLAEPLSFVAYAFDAHAEARLHRSSAASIMRRCYPHLGRRLQLHWPRLMH